MSKTRAEIEAEIARLTARLDHVGFDPAFTPTELVRWDPSLVGTVLHIKHERNIPANAFEHPLCVNRESKDGDFRVDSMYGSSNPARAVEYGTFVERRITSDKCMEKVGVLVRGGIQSSIEEQLVIPDSAFDGGGNRRKHKLTVSDEFLALTHLSFIYMQHSVFSHSLSATYGPGKMYDLSCKDLGMSTKNCTNPGNGGLSNLILPLANPDRPLLDQIFVATSTRVHDTDIIVDKYPLSTLYNEWKRDKEAARGLPPPRRTELDVAKAQIAELQAQMRLLMADREADQARAAELSKQNGRLRDALHVAVHTPNLMGFVPAAATAAAAAAVSTNATALTNATAAADPV